MNLTRHSRSVSNSGISYSTELPSPDRTNESNISGVSAFQVAPLSMLKSIFHDTFRSLPDPSLNVLEERLVMFILPLPPSLNDSTLLLSVSNLYSRPVIADSSFSRMMSSMPADLNCARSRSMFRIPDRSMSMLPGSEYIFLPASVPSETRDSCIFSSPMLSGGSTMQKSFGSELSFTPLPQLSVSTLPPSFSIIQAPDADVQYRLPYRFLSALSFISLT